MANPSDPTEPTSDTSSTWSSELPAEDAVPAAGASTTAPTRAGARRGLIAVGIVAALALGGVLGAVIANAADDNKSTTTIDRTSFDQQMPGDGQTLPPGSDPRGVDPDGDNWTGGGRGPRGDHHDRGVDPDGDNWTGGGGMSPDSTPTTTAGAGA